MTSQNLFTFSCVCLVSERNEAYHVLVVFGFAKYPEGLEFFIVGSLKVGVIYWLR
jgi:hypothetical protein